MNMLKVIDERHSVRQYFSKEIEDNIKNSLISLIDEINKNYDLNIQLICNDKKTFDCFLSHYGKFVGVENYIALVGKKRNGLNEKLGYCGQKIVLHAQALGLNTCWVALSYKKNKNLVKISKGEKFVAVIAVGYGKNQGVEHKSKHITQVSNVTDNSPEWFVLGAKCALKAPTALNQQKFYFELKDGKVKAKRKAGFYTLLDLGIAKFHFEIGAGKDSSIWQK